MSESLYMDGTLGAGKAWVAKHRDDGVTCPCCGQFAKVYLRQINSSMCEVLVLMYRMSLKTRVRDRGRAPWIHVGRDIIQVQMTRSTSGDYAKLRHWGLIEPMPHEEDETKSSGYWRITSLGRDFVNGKLRVQQFARIYANKCIGSAGPMVNMEACAGKRFHYVEMMKDKPL